MTIRQRFQSVMTGIFTSVIGVPTSTQKWTVFIRRTNNPKIEWLEEQLDALEIPHRRHGNLFHVPILEVPENKLASAQILLDSIDNTSDDDPWFRRIWKKICYRNR